MFFVSVVKKNKTFSFIKSQVDDDAVGNI